MTHFNVSDRKTLAAFVYGEGEDPNRIVADFAEDLARRGHRLGGVIQIAAAAQDCECRETHVLDLETGEHLSILQDLGRHSQSCRIDSAALAAIGHRISSAIARNPELLFINRFGKLEAEGKGVFAEIGEAAAADIPTVVTVSTRYLDQWRQFTSGLDEELACSSESLRQWWADISALRAVGI
ncbi:DUF2478 domain-containing protein [Methylocapsa polymorpha]|uniref:DUF2478 domain-containing protein n=1 Tax=Methylocapsa polymorpha TaxID=3080828 RepID=A0ABZ0HR33_9HYPH|nr:DUF2478 domain-containing protein [Methylocapsa sp. RX1]